MNDWKMSKNHGNFKMRKKVDSVSFFVKIESPFGCCASYFELVAKDFSIILLFVRSFVYLVLFPYVNWQHTNADTNTSATNSTVAAAAALLLCVSHTRVSAFVIPLF